MKHIRLIFLTLFILFSGVVASAEKININTANKETLMMINGIGDKKADLIIAYRKENGAFKSVDALANIKGISSNMLDKNRAVLSIK